MNLNSEITTILVFFSILITIWLGYKLRLKLIQGEDKMNVGPLEGSLLGLLALLLSFSFNASYSRFNDRRNALINEANALRATAGRIYLLPDSLSNQYRGDMYRLVANRIAYYHKGEDEAEILKEMDSSQYYLIKIWTRIKEMSKNEKLNIKTSLIVTSLTTAYDSMEIREDMRSAKIPDFIKIALFVLILVSSLVIGFNIDDFKSKRFIVFAFATMIALTCYLILDLEHSRNGLINLDSTEQKMEEVLQLFSRVS